MAAFINDGSIPYGSQVITLKATTAATTGVAFIADNVDFSDPSKEIQRTNQLDEPSGSVNINDFSTATATLQFSSSTVATPAKGHVATLARNDGTTAWYFVYERSEPQAKGEDHKCNVTFKLYINP